MRIGVFGGAFNPVHNGHVKLAESFLERLSLDKLLIIPTAVPPHKTAAGLANEKNRLDMLSLAFKNIEKAEISDLEFKRSGKSYTFDTIAEIRNIYRYDELFLIIGEDQFLSFDKWYRYRDLLSQTVLCTAARTENKRQEIERFAAVLLNGKSNYYLADFAPVIVSSSEIREKLKKGQDVSALLPEQVYSYIKENRLYVV